jgi:hypothetical protein
MEKSLETNSRTSAKHDQILWFLVLAGSLLLNAFFLTMKRNKADEVLASVSGQTFRWQDVSQEGQTDLQKMDAAYYRLLRAEAELWAEKVVLTKEALSRGISVDELLKSQPNDTDDKQWLQPLFSKYGVKFEIKPPAGYENLEQANA